MQKLSRWSICIHESGHVVSHYFLFSQPVGAVVFEEGGGICTQTPETAQPFKLETSPTAQEHATTSNATITARSLLNECIYCASGYLAQYHFLKECSQMLFKDNGDSRIITGHFLAVHPDANEDEICAFMALIHNMAEPVVKRYAKFIQRVALRLNDKGMLSPAETLEAMFCTED
jgi:hypothetical protein